MLVVEIVDLLGVPRPVHTVPGVHLLIGVGEAVVTVAAVSAVLATRPDLIPGVAERRVRPILLGVR